MPDADLVDPEIEELDAIAAPEPVVDPAAGMVVAPPATADPPPAADPVADAIDEPLPVTEHDPAAAPIVEVIAMPEPVVDDDLVDDAEAIAVAPPAAVGMPPAEAESAPDVFEVPLWEGVYVRAVRPWPLSQPLLVM